MIDPIELPPITHEPMTLVLLAHETAAPLEETVAAWATWVHAHRPKDQLVVIEASGGASAGRGSVLVERVPRLGWLSIPCRGGFGTALRAGLAQARTPLVCYLPCDGQFDPADLARMLSKIDQADIVSARRRHRPGSSRMMRWFRRFIVRLLFGLRLHDVGSPFVLARRSALRRVFVQSEGDFAATEVLAKANFLGALMAEVAVTSRAPSSDSRPESAEDSPPGWWRELRQTLAHPDFGPTVLPEPDPHADAQTAP